MTTGANPTPAPTAHDRAREAIADVLGGALIDADEIVMVGKGSDPRLYRNEEAILAALEAAGLAVVDAGRVQRWQDAMGGMEMLLFDSGQPAKWGHGEWRERLEMLRTYQDGDLDPLPATADQEEGR